MSKVKVLGQKYGIEITRPWSSAMYDHNHKIQEQMHCAIAKAIHKAYTDKNEKDMRIIGTALNAYGYGDGMTFEDITKDCHKGLQYVQNHWLHSDTWPDLLKAKLVEPLEQGFIGYDK